MKLHIHHETRIHYSEPVSYSIRQLRLTPREDGGQHTLSWTVRANGQTLVRRDAWGNIAHLMTLEGPHSDVRIEVDGIVETCDDASVLPETQSALHPLTYLATTPLTTVDEALRAFAERELDPQRDLAESLKRFSTAIGKRVKRTAGNRDPLGAIESFKAGQADPRDLAHIFIAGCRARSLPARFVSGYLLDTSGRASSHAWADVWLEGRGWLACDVTGQRLADGRYCRIAIGRDFLDACPVRSARTGGGDEAMQEALAMELAA
jgi:transglutaminase-like putative cysteine protease